MNQPPDKKKPQRRGRASGSRGTPPAPQGTIAKSAITATPAHDELDADAASDGPGSAMHDGADSEVGDPACPIDPTAFDDEDFDAQIEDGLQRGLALAIDHRSVGLRDDASGPSGVATIDGVASPQPTAAQSPHETSTFAPLPVPERLLGEVGATRVWEQPGFRAVVGTLTCATRELVRDLESVLKQDLALHEAVLGLAASTLRQRAEELASPTDADGAAMAGRIASVRSALAEQIRTGWHRRFALYYDDDPVSRGLERTLHGLETLPSRAPLVLDLGGSRALGPFARLGARFGLVSTTWRLALPVRRVLSLTVASAHVHTLEGYFPRRAAMRARALETLESLVQTLSAIPDPEGEAGLGGEQQAARLGERLLEAATELEELIGEVSTMATGALGAARVAVRAVDGWPVEAALASGWRGDWRVRIRSLYYAVFFALLRGFVRLGRAHVERLEHRVLHHPRLTEALPTLTRRSAQTLSRLREELQQDRNHFAATIEPLDEALARARDRFVHLFDEVDTRDLHGRHRALRRASARHLKQIYRVFERRVLVPLQRHFSADPLASTLERAATEALGIGDGMGSLNIEFQRPQTPAIRFLVWLRLIRSSKQTVFPLQRIVEQWLVRRQAEELLTLQVDREPMRAALLRSVTEVWNVVRYNLEGAVADVDEIIDSGCDDETTLDACTKGAETAVGGLERAIAKLRGLLTEIDAFHATVLTMHQSKLDFARQVRADAAAAASLRGRLRYHLGRLRLGLWQGGRRLRAAVREGRGLGLDAVRVLYQQLKERSLGLRQFLGFVGDETADFVPPSEEAVAEVLVRDWDHLPPVYRRLFSLEALEFDEFLVARDEAFARIDDARRRWDRGERACVLLHGSPGSGKRSLLSCAVDRCFANASVERVEVEDKLLSEQAVSRFMAHAFELESEPQSAEELKAALLAAEPRVMVIERADNVFLRRIGGFEALKRLLLVIARTSHHHLWIVVLEDHSYALLQRLFRVADAFTHVVALTRMDEATLRRAVLTRHEPSGFVLEFQFDGELPQKLGRELRRARGDGHAEQAVLTDYYFEQLHHVANGNIYVALFYWLRSIKAIEGNLLRVSPVKPMVFPSLQRLSQDQLFSAAALLQHGQLSVRELAEVFDWDLIKCRLIFQYFEQHYITLRVGEEVTDDTDATVFRINHLMLRPLLDLLQNRHIVYWS